MAGIGVGNSRFNPELHGFDPATTVDLFIAQPRTQLEGKESYLFQVTAQLEMAGNVADDVGSFGCFSRRCHRRSPGLLSHPGIGSAVAQYCPLWAPLSGPHGFVSGSSQATSQ